MTSPLQQDPLVDAIKEFQRVNGRLPSDDEAERMARILQAPEPQPAKEIAGGPSRMQEFAATFAPVTTGVPQEPLTKALLPLSEAATVGTFDDFLKLGERMASGEILSSAKLPQLVIEPAGFAARLPKPLREVSGFGAMAIQHPIEAAAGLVTLPFHLAANAYKTLDPANIRESAGPGIHYELYAKMTPDESDEARRALAGFVVSMAAAGPAGAVAGRFAGALGAPVGVQRFISAQAAAVAGGATFGLIEAPPGDQADRAIAYGLMALPLGFAFKVMRPLYKIEATDIKGADVMARAQQVRPFDEPAPASVREIVVDVSTATNEAEAAALSAEVMKKAEAMAATRGETVSGRLIERGLEKPAQMVEVTGPESEVMKKEFGPSFFEQIHPDPRAVRAAETRTERLQIKAQNAIRAGKNLTNAILLNFRDLKSQEMSVVQGLDTPGQALAAARQILGSDMVVATHKRPDGQFDVAIGRPDSRLAQARGQFATEGFVKGEAVYVDGKPYSYVRSRGEGTQLRDVGTGRFLFAPKSQLRRGPETSFIEYNPEARRLLEQSLTEKELKLYDFLFDAIHKDGKLPEPSLTRAAASNGLHIDRDNAGGHLVRDSQTGEILFRTPWQSEALSFVNRSGQRVGPDFTFGTGGVPPEIISSIMPPPDQPPPINASFDPPVRGKAAHFVDWFNLEAARFPGTAMGDLVASFDNIYGTDLTNKMFIPTQNATQARAASVRPFAERLRGLHERLGDMSPADRELITSYRRARSPQEIAALLNSTELNTGKLLAELKIDTAKIYKFSWMRTDALKHRARRLRVTPDRLPPEIRAEEVSRLAHELGMTPADLKAAELFDAIAQADFADIDLVKVTRYANALMTKSPSRAEFAARNKLTPQQIKTALELDQIRNDAGKAADLERPELVEDYVDHYTSLAYHGALTGESSFLWQKGRAISPERAFVSEALRGGDFIGSTRDPIASAWRFVNAGFSVRDFNPIWKQARADALDIIKNLRKPGAGEMARRIFHDGYLNEIRGGSEAAVRFTQATTDEFFRLLGQDVAPDVRRQLVNSLLSTTNAAAIGFRVGQGVRDLVSYYKLYGALYGFDRATNGISLAMEKGVVQQLRNRGILPGTLSPIEVATAEELARTGLGKRLSALPGLLNRIAEAGLTASLQKNVYEIIHSAAYLDTRQVVLTEVSKFVKGQQTKQKAYERMKLFTYDPRIVEEFNKIVDSGEVERAADYLGRETSRRAAFVYGQASHPYGWGTNVGRLGTQFGRFSVSARNFVARGLTQGTGKDRAAFFARSALAEAAMWATGQALGFNFMSWYILPGMLFTGGPAVQTGLMVANLVSPFEIDRRIAWNRVTYMLPTLSSPGSLFLPGSYFLGDLYKAVDQAENLVEFGGRAIGIPLREGRSWLDEF